VSVLPASVLDLLCFSKVQRARSSASLIETSLGWF